MTIAKCTENGSNPPKFDLILIEGGYEGGENRCTRFCHLGKYKGIRKFPFTLLENSNSIVGELQFLFGNNFG